MRAQPAVVDQPYPVAAAIVRRFEHLQGQDVPPREFGALFSHHTAGAHGSARFATDDLDEVRTAIRRAQQQTRELQQEEWDRRFSEELQRAGYVGPPNARTPTDQRALWQSVKAACMAAKPCLVPHRRKADNASSRFGAAH